MRLRRAASGRVWAPFLTRLTLAFLAAVPLAALFDRAAIEFVRSSDAAVIHWLHAATDIGRSHWYLVPAGVVLLGLGLYDWTRAGYRGRARLALLYGQAAFVFGAVALPGMLVNVLKIGFGRFRPQAFDQLGAWAFDPFTTGYLNASFPSGHSTTMGAVTAILILWFPRYWPAIAGVGFVLAASRIAAEAHYPSDVAAGFGIGLVSAMALARFLAARRIGFRLASGRALPEVPGNRPDSVHG